MKRKIFSMVLTLYAVCILCFSNTVCSATYGDGSFAVRQGKDPNVYVHWYSNDKILVLGGSGTVYGSDITAYSRSGVKEIVIEDGITDGTVGNLSGMNALETIRLDANIRFSSVEEYTYRVFEECENLQSISVGNNNTYYTSEDGVLYNKNQTTMLFYPRNKSDSSYFIPDGVTRLEQHAFEYCKNIQSVSLPDGISGNAFDYCTSLTNITCRGDVKIFGFEDTGYYNNSDNWDGNMLYLGNSLIAAKRLDDDGYWMDGIYAIKDGIQHICTSFYDASAEEHNEIIVIPGSVKDAGYRWVDGNGSCHRTLGPIGTDCEVQYGWTEAIPDDMFRDSHFDSIIIPKNIKKIGKMNFTWDLPTIYYEGTQEDWQQIQIGDVNYGLDRSTIHYNYRKPNPPRIADTPTVNNGEITVGLADVEYTSNMIAVFADTNGLVAAETVELTAGDTEKSVEIPSGATQAKIFIWDSLSNMRPLCEPVTVNISGE